MVQENKKVKILVRGGVAYPTTIPKGIEVIIVDYDIEGTDDEEDRKNGFSTTSFTNEDVFKM